MVSRKVTVINTTGLHLRPAGVLCREALKYECRIMMKFQGTEANVKSVLSVLGACVKCQDEIEIVCEGPDEVPALETLTAAIESGLGE
jgi:phosphocarrier protein